MQCRYGVVILFQAFFSKHYPNRELDGLAQREVNGQTVILPVWNGVTDSEVRSYSPPLAGRIAARWEDGLIPVVLEILRVARPDLLKTIERAVADAKALPELRTGKELIGVVNGALGYDFSNEELSDEVELDLVGGFLQQLQDWGDLVDGFDVSERLRAEFQVAEALKALSAAGWKVFGHKEKRRAKDADEADDWPIAVVVVTRSTAELVIRLPDGDFAVARRPQRGSSFNPASASDGSATGEGQ